MFTGLVEEQAVVSHVEPGRHGATLTVRSLLAIADASIGDSVALNGCCLTVVATEDDCLVFEAVQETLDRTNLGRLRSESRVNLERSLKLGDRMGGHYVTGHVDAVGHVDQIDLHDGWKKFWFQVPPPVIAQMASKGSVAVDGVSLTLVDVEQSRFSVALIPHTLSVTTFGVRKVGDTVNIETDVLAKYVESQLNARSMTDS